MTSEPATSHAVAAAEIARLRAEVAALREAAAHLVDTVSVLRGKTPCDEDMHLHEQWAMNALRAVLAEQEQAP